MDIAKGIVIPAEMSGTSENEIHLYTVTVEHCLDSSTSQRDTAAAAPLIVVHNALSTRLFDHYLIRQEHLELEDDEGDAINTFEMQIKNIRMDESLSDKSYRFTGDLTALLLYPGDGTPQLNEHGEFDFLPPETLLPGGNPIPVRVTVVSNEEGE